jgi:GDP-D-mannose 3', 5'-epimerase
MAKDGATIEVWGDGLQTRSFLFIDECIEATIRLMRSDVDFPVNIGSDEMISVNNLVKLIASISGKKINIANIAGPEGMRGRNSNNRLIAEVLGWAPSQNLRPGMEVTYAWINSQNSQ